MEIKILIFLEWLLGVGDIMYPVHCKNRPFSQCPKCSRHPILYLLVTHVIELIINWGIITSEERCSDLNELTYDNRFPKCIFFFEMVERFLEIY